MSKLNPNRKHINRAFAPQFDRPHTLAPDQASYPDEMPAELYETLPGAHHFDALTPIGEGCYMAGHLPAAD